MSANKPLGLDDITYIASAEGMARRVLQDLEKANLSKEELADAYHVDLELLGSSYVHLMELGRLLEDLDALSKESKK